MANCPSAAVTDPEPLIIPVTVPSACHSYTYRDRMSELVTLLHNSEINHSFITISFQIQSESDIKTSPLRGAEFIDENEFKSY